MEVRFRHRLVYIFLKPLGRLIFRIKYGYKGIRIKGKEKGPFFIMSNHTSMLDPVMLAFSFKGPIYYVASDDIFSIPFWSKILKFLVSPIPKVKGSSDLITIKAMINIAKKKQHIAIYPSGNTSYSGCEEHIPSQIGRLAKKMKLPIALFNSFGLYGVDPRWARAVRKGPAFGKVVEVIPYEEFKDMPDDELDARIVRGLSTNAFEQQVGTYKSKYRAEYLERVMFLCPDCEGIATMHSQGASITCSKCGYQIEYGEDLHFHPVKGNTHFRTVKEYYDFLRNYMQKYDFSKHAPGEVLLSDDGERFILNERAKRKTILEESATVKMYVDRLEIVGEKQKHLFPLENIRAIAVQNRSKMLFYTEDAMYQLKGKLPRSALKYIFFFYAIHKKVQKDGSLFMGI
jgi:1-acyl-sn-glycerol-3-phosphate acyltransferase